jgi:hypothetical protein
MISLSSIALRGVPQGHLEVFSAVVGLMTNNQSDGCSLQGVICHVTASSLPDNPLTEGERMGDFAVSDHCTFENAATLIVYETPLLCYTVAVQLRSNGLGKTGYSHTQAQICYTKNRIREIHPA